MSDKKPVHERKEARGALRSVSNDQAVRDDPILQGIISAVPAIASMAWRGANWIYNNYQPQSAQEPSIEELQAKILELEAQNG